MPGFAQAFADPGLGDLDVTSAGKPQRPAILRNDIDAVLMLDGNGWVTDVNPHAQRLLGIGVHERPKAQAHLQDLIVALQAAGGGRFTTLPLVALNLDGLLLLNSALGESHGDAALDLIGNVVQPQYARCGLLARVATNQYLAKLPHTSHPADAAVSVSGGRVHAARFPASSRGAVAVNDAPPLSDGDYVRAPRLAADLSEAIQSQALSVHFQPQYEIPGGRGCGVEALVRWTLPSGQSVAPGSFIPRAERNGDIGALDAWVLKTACTTALRWRGVGTEPLTLSVNVSDREIGREHARMLDDVLRISGFPSHRLELEIGEGPVVSNSSEVKECVKQWKQLGVRIAVCHGSAIYSSLEYLSQMSVDRLKLDRSLIHGMTQNPQTASKVRAIIAVCAEFKVDVVAEGVESESQLAMLKDFDCPRAQGFLLARPMPPVQAQVVLGKKWGNLAIEAQNRQALAR
jgi:EAL domain-containing protein (putative c-di-GMP-specific phosphodiesterase class I)